MHSAMISPRFFWLLEPLIIARYSSNLRTIQPSVIQHSRSRILIGEGCLQLVLILVRAGFFSRFFSAESYCVFDSTPREGTFLVISCPDSKGEDLYQCSCSIGVGNPVDAPNTPTCDLCSFCPDETLSYNCQNVASGTCIGRDCGDNCIASADSATMVHAPFLVSLLTLTTIVQLWVLWF